MRRIFFVAFFDSGVVWPILSEVVLVMAALGILIGVLEGWGVGDALYFTFVTGLTIGYGDLTPYRALSRLLAVAIGFAGIVLTGLVTAICVHALRDTVRGRLE